MAGSIVFFALVVVWVGFDTWLLVGRDRARARAEGAPPPPPDERRSKIVMVACIVVGMTGGVSWHAGAQAAWLAPFGWSRWLGVALLGLAVAGRVLAVRALGGGFTVEVRAPAAAALRTDGVYGVIRHPAYAAELLAFVGVALAYHHPFTSTLALTLPTAGLLYRIRVEERVLADRLGPAYRAYMARTKRLVPFVW